MSRILKALDRLEQENSARLATSASERLFDLPDCGAKRVHPRAPSGKRRLAWVGVVLILALAAAFVGRPAYQFVGHPAPVPDGGPSDAQIDPLAGDSGVGTGAADASDPFPEQIDYASEFAAPARFLNSPSDRPASAAISQAVSTQPGATAASGPIVDGRVDRERIRLQAIVWSPVASERKAVINEEIVCEGESVDGLSIVAINVEDVIFSHQGRLLKATLGR